MDRCNGERKAECIDEGMSIGIGEHGPTNKYHRQRSQGAHAISVDVPLFDGAAGDDGIMTKHIKDRMQISCRFLFVLAHLSVVINSLHEIPRIFPLFNYLFPMNDFSCNHTTFEATSTSPQLYHHYHFIICW
jgi:hypothetical protein